MARPLGSKNAPGHTAGRPSKSRNLTERLTPDEQLEVKKAILLLMEAEEVRTVTEACRKISFSPLKAYHWMETDPEWAGQLKQAEQIQADRLIETLDKKEHILGLMFHIKKIRPEYRETAKFDISYEPLEKLLKELKDIAQRVLTERTESLGVTDVVEGEFKVLPEETDGRTEGNDTSQTA